MAKDIYLFIVIQNFELLVKRKRHLTQNINNLFQIRDIFDKLKSNTRNYGNLAAKFQTNNVKAKLLFSKR